MVRAFLLSLILAFAPAAAMAHDHPAVGPNGGKIIEAGSHHIEFILKDGTVRAYLYDENMKAVAAEGAEVNVTIQSQGKRETVKLQAAGANLMQGATTLAAGPGLRAIVALKMPGKPIVQARVGE
ncbi:MAG: hypothetical protein HY246_10535 [Proteobacteria bacterium]|nr:hypothetical protein [Pseudomonadota bacterium]